MDLHARRDPGLATRLVVDEPDVLHAHGVARVGLHEAHEEQSVGVHPELLAPRLAGQRADDDHPSPLERILVHAREVEALATQQRVGAGHGVGVDIEAEQEEVIDAGLGADEAAVGGDELAVARVEHTVAPAHRVEVDAQAAGQLERLVPGLHVPRAVWT